MELSKKPYKGTRDFFPPEKRVRDYLFAKMSSVAELFGYESYDGPILEEVDLYKAKSGEEIINEQIYDFVDKGERHVAIRPEMTPTLARMVAQVHREVPKPLRWYAIPNLMRYERPQRGRLREHWQYNCDIFGAPSPYGEAEILQVAISLLRGFGATSKDFEILVNDRRIVNGLFEQALKADPEQSHKLIKLIDRAKKLSPEEFNQQLGTIQLSADQGKLFKEYLELSGLSDLLSFLDKTQLSSVAPEFPQIFKILSCLGLEDYLSYDPTIVRGLDYYTGLVFEIFDKSPENRRAICGGGAYDKLLEIFNEPPMRGVGFGLGDVTLTDFLKTHNLLPDLSKAKTDLYVAFSEQGLTHAQKWAQDLRNAGVSTVLELTPAKPQKAIGNAEKRGARFFAYVGDDEVQKGQVQLRNLNLKSQQAFTFQDLDSLKEHVLCKN